METFTCYEKIDVPNLNRMLKIEEDPQKKAKLLKFAKEITKEGILECKYKNKKYVKGRLYAYPSLQGVDKYTRQAISVPSWDFDIINAYPTILRNLCDKHSIKCELLSSYVSDREAWFKLGITKDNMIHSLFGSQEYTAIDQLSQFRTEISKITTLLTSLPIYKDLARAVRALKSDDNKNSLVSYIIQNEELEIMTDVLNKIEDKFKKAEIQSYIFDGFMIRKTDQLNPHDILAEINKWVEGYKVQFAIKPFECPLKPEEVEEENPFEEFELTHCKIMNPYCYIRETDKEVQILNKEQLHGIYYNKPLIGKSGFINAWCLDPNMRTYENMDFLPPPFKVPDNIYNMWKGFPVEPVIGTANKFFEHIRKLIPNKLESEWLITWIASIIQQPGKRTNICPILIGGQGIGKGFLIEQFLGTLFGKYFYHTEDPKQDLFERFAEARNCKLLVNIDDFNVGTIKMNNDPFKSLITGELMNYEAKGKPKISNKNCTNFIITTQSTCPVKIETDDRRYALIGCSEVLKNNWEYFSNLKKYWDVPENQQAVMSALLDYDTTTIDLKRDRPMNEMYQEIKLMSAEKELLFLGSIIQDTTNEYRSNDLYNKYTHWLLNNGFKEYNPKNSISFGIYISKINGITFRQSAGKIYMIHKPELVEYLEKKGIQIQNICRIEADDI